MNVTALSSAEQRHTDSLTKHADTQKARGQDRSYHAPRNRGSSLDREGFPTARSSDLDAAWFLCGSPDPGRSF